MPPSSERDSLLPAYHRHDIRLPGYDYSTPGTYFITICVQNRACIFGDVVNGEMTLDEVGSMIDGWWMTTDQHFAGAESDASMIMPNHFHALVRIGWTEDSHEGSRHGGLRLREGEGDALSNDGSPAQSRHDPIAPDSPGALLMHVCPKDVRADHPSGICILVHHVNPSATRSKTRIDPRRTLTRPAVCPRCAPCRSP